MRVKDHVPGSKMEGGRGGHLISSVACVQALGHMGRIPANRFLPCTQIFDIPPHTSRTKKTGVLMKLERTIKKKFKDYKYENYE